MKQLTITQIDSGRRGLDTMKITGFSDEILYSLKHMKHEDAKESVIELLDERNNGIGTCWHNGNGIYGLWFDNEAAYMNIGSSAD